MKTITKSYYFELRPTQKQKVLLDKHFGCTRFVYNYFLNERIKQYKANEKIDRFYDQSRILTNLKKQTVYSWLKEVNCQSLQSSLKNLDAAYNYFYRGYTNLPKFKSKRSRNSFTVPQNSKLKGNRIYIPKFKGGIKCIVHRECRGKVRSMVVSKTPTGKYFVSILVEEQCQSMGKTGKICGVDLGIKDFAITSDGVRFENHRYTLKYEKKLADAQRHLSRKQIGSNSYENQRRKVAKIYEKVVNSRRDNLHKLSHQLVSEYDFIALEDLAIKKMMRNRKLAKHIADASWGTFVKFVEYKADWNGKQVVKINRYFPSSKTCSVCGWIKKDLTLADREWTCENGHHLDRDINAANNILKEGLKTIGVGLSDNMGGSIEAHSSFAFSN